MIEIIFTISLVLGMIPALSLFDKFINKEPIPNKLKILLHRSRGQGAVEVVQHSDGVLVKSPAGLFC